VPTSFIDEGNRRKPHNQLYSGIDKHEIEIPKEIRLLQPLSPKATLDLQLPVQSVPITTKVVCSNPVYGEVYLIQTLCYEVCQ
jgi:hypothetical protein